VKGLQHRAAAVLVIIASLFIGVGTVTVAQATPSSITSTTDDASGNGVATKSHGQTTFGSQSPNVIAPPPSTFPADCPATIKCVVMPAPYVANGGDVTDYGDYDVTNRPQDMKINTIVIHDTEGDLQSTLDTFNNSHSYVSIHYVVVASLNEVIEMVPNNDMAWHAGNWYENMHAIGIEHVGFSADSSSYTDTMYRLSADLVQYLTAKYNVPRDRAHILGHDNVSGTTAAAIPAMHTDPGEFWDWQKYMTLINGGVQLNAAANPLTATSNFNLGVTVMPLWPLNKQPVTGCTSATSCVPAGLQPTNFVYLHAQPNANAPLFTDPVLGQGTTDINNTAARLYYGQTFAVADHKIDSGGLWLKVAVNGTYGWFYSPWTAPTAFPAIGGQYATPKTSSDVAVYGQPVPEKSEYPADLISVPPANTWIKFPTALPYTLKSGQKYKVLSTNVPTDYFYAWASDGSFPYDHTVFTGATKYIEIQLGSRIAFVKANDVNLN